MMSQIECVPAPRIEPRHWVSGHDPSDRELLLRFVNQRQEAAFETLVQRHGPMVQGVCRRVLGDAHEAEDAFQATFLVLVRKSDSIRRPELLANWLYGVAFRIAHKARVNAFKREKLPMQTDELATQEQLVEVEWAEVKTVLDEEINRLPEKYRAPLVLCYFNGKTNIEAARLLGWPEGSISERLAKGREALRRRLNRRGVTLSAALLALLLSQKAASAAVPAALIESTVTAAVVFAGHPAAVGEVSASVARMVADATTRTIPAWLKLSLAASLFLLATLIALPTLQEARARSGLRVFGDSRIFGGTSLSPAGCSGNAAPVVTPVCPAHPGVGMPFAGSPSGKSSVANLPISGESASGSTASGSSAAGESPAVANGCHATKSCAKAATKTTTKATVAPAIETRAPAGGTP